MAEGRLPNFARLAAPGGFAPLATSMPPQSPVAWSTFITGLDPGGHGIFDFIHRDPDDDGAVPVDDDAPSRRRAMLTLGDWQFPLSGGQVELLRHGQPFWEVLEARGIETTIIRMPANFPPSGTATRELSGMGTPDILGTYGTFSFYTSEPFAFGRPDAVGRRGVAGRRRRRTSSARRSKGRTTRFSSSAEKVTRRFTRLPRSRERQSAKLVVGDEERVLRSGEWSDWVPVDFDAGAVADAARRCAVLPEAAAAVLRALRQPDQPRSAGAGAADLDARRLRRRAGARPPAASTRRACPRTPRA